ncbi:hypothetical protein LJC42_03200 [Eubacteriales bacterium OttesenSCG-928-K08]|nr:hypothetical protein [Eubacteriales bacterium OttesenSCG-928-K08]
MYELSARAVRLNPAKQPKNSATASKKLLSRFNFALRENNPIIVSPVFLSFH